MDKETIIKHAKIELAKRDFFYYCNLRAGDFYKANREYLVNLCNSFQSFIEGEDQVMVINVPPR